MEASMEFTVSGIIKGRAYDNFMLNFYPVDAMSSILVKLRSAASKHEITDFIAI